jgi:hypothetical protein
VVPSPVVMTLTDSQTIQMGDYLDAGYTNFDVICIGAGGGSGGGIDTENTGTFARSYGGAGGGGGIHRVAGLISGLPYSVDVVVGEGGAKGTDDISNPANTTAGVDGGASTFGGTVCRASGGKGGVRVQANSLTSSSLANGGDGGIGGQTTAGGGAAGGTSGIPTSTGPGTAGTAGTDGLWDGSIGEGGGGGGGGVGKYTGSVTCVTATNGGRGAYNPSDLSAYANGGYPTTDPDAGSLSTVPGKGGGAKASLLNNSPTVHGSGGENGPGNPGIVVILITAV